MLITLGLDVDVWRVAADKMDVFAPVVITFLDEHNLVPQATNPPPSPFLSVLKHLL